MSISAKDLNNIASQIANFKTSTLGSLTSSSKEAGFDISTLASQYLSQQSGLTALTAPSTSTALDGVSAIGRNMSLPDPESAYQMMSEINHRAQIYPAQQQVLSQMQDGVKQLAQAVTPLGSISSDMNVADVKAKIQQFADQYNSWRLSFDADVQDPELLADTQAAKMARYELAASINSPFHGATSGLQGLGALGLTIDPQTQMARIDGAQLAAAWLQKPQAVAQALNDFSQDFTQSANLLSAPNNFFQKQLGNLQQAISYLNDNLPKLQQEFGIGDTPELSPRVAQALAAYQAQHGTYSSKV
jgi:hypothetical protein